MARSLEPYRDRFLPDQFQRWIEILRNRVRTVPCFVESSGSPEGVIDGQKGDFYFDTSGNVYYYKTTDTGNTGWAVLSVGVTPPGGADTEIQFNNAGSFGGITAGVAGTVLTSTGVGSTPTYQTGASPGGGLNAVQFNNPAGTFDGSPNFTWNGTTLLVNGNIESQTWVQIGSSNMRFDATAGQIMELSNAVGTTTTLEFQDSTLTAMASIQANTSGELHLQGFGFVENTIGILYVKDSDTSGTTALARVGFRDSVNANMGNIGFSTADSNLQISNQLASGDINLVTIASGAVNMQFGGVNMARTVIAASGGLEVNNTVTGAGFERVLTTSDIVSAAAAGSTNEIQFNTGGAFDADPFISLDLTAGSGQAPQLRLDGTSGSYRRPTLVFNYDLSDEGGIEWEEEGGVRGYIRYYATGPGGGTDVLRIWNPVNGGATSNSITEIGAENLLRYRANEEGNDFRGPIRVDSVPGPAFPDTVGHGVIFLDSGDGDVKFRNSAGAEFSMTSGLAPAGNVSNTGTPLNNQVAVWTDATTIEGDADFTWNGVNLTIGGGGSVISDVYQANNGLTIRTFGVLAATWDTSQNLQLEGDLTVNNNLIDLDNSSAATASTIINRNSAGGVTLNINTTTGHAQIGQTSGAGAAEDVWIHFTRNGQVELRHNNTATARTDTVANGGFEVNNTVTGAGFERVLTTSDLGGGGSPWAYRLIVGTSATAVAGDFIVASNTGTVTITLPSGHSVNDTIIVKKTGATGTVTVDANASETIDGALTFPLSTQYDTITLISDGTNWLIV